MGAWPATQFRFDVPGHGVPAGYNDNQPGADGATIVTFMATPATPAGSTQFPFVPVTCTVYGGPPSNAVPRGPTWDSRPRVSINRHGVTGTNVDSPAPGNAPARPAFNHHANTTAATIPAANHPTDRNRTVTVITHP